MKGMELCPNSQQQTNEDSKPRIRRIIIRGKATPEETTTDTINEFKGSYNGAQIGFLKLRFGRPILFISILYSLFWLLSAGGRSIAPHNNLLRGTSCGLRCRLHAPYR